ncbi:hypothetical protein A1O1_06732 [Capronia coronata CBS 617.96]|uniref:WSC domain-containing protein n=1 Tax=Capronia coronata CBS 617.96 TaxID=1182541 RepID=W9XS99_9EURO|nr:uncharacterized protein A1O1_06732 [Capronia coronata CBS 617.96]EXJ83113.1 hypothetical protein A1O1_06732 [Capronia coronata CBS 617.96]
MTNGACVSFCDSRGFAVAGTEYAGQCFCGTDADFPAMASQLDESQCDMPCTGAGGEMCGGSGALSVWAKGGASSSTTTSNTDSGKLMMVKRRFNYLGGHGKRMVRPAMRD